MSFLLLICSWEISRICGPHPVYRVAKVKRHWCDFARMHICLYVSVYCNQRRRWHPTPVLLPGKSRGWRSPVGCSPWGRSESDRTERLHFHFSLSCIGAGNGNPLQCSCLENPRDGGAWWAVSMGLHRVGHDWSDLAAVAAALPSSKRIYAPNEPNRTRDYQLFT